ncbi:MAG: nucleotide exchange factor GrpE [Patescibacteria group bacterium]
MTDTKHDKQAKQSSANTMKKAQEELVAKMHELDAARKERDEYKQKYLRALADYQNFEKRVITDKEATIKNANKYLIIKLLNFLDDLERAEIFIKDQNLKIIKESFHKLLEKEGLKELDVQNKQFDPVQSEVVDVVEGDEDGQVVEVFRKGYEFNGNIIRVAQVKVAKRK